MPTKLTDAQIDLILGPQARIYSAIDGGEFEIKNVIGFPGKFILQISIQVDKKPGTGPVNPLFSVKKPAKKKSILKK